MECKESCPHPYYGNKLKMICQLNCIDNQKIYMESRLCVDICPYPYFSKGGINYCVDKCDFNEYSDATLR